MTCPRRLVPFSLLVSLSLPLSVIARPPLLELLERRIVRRKLREKIADARSRATELHSAVREQEFNYIEMQRQLANISPRATQQGWKEELDQNVAEHFEWITKSVQKNT